MGPHATAPSQSGVHSPATKGLHSVCRAGQTQGPPARHVVPSQQPAQLWPSQTHVPLAHRWPVAHETQTPPPPPHAPSVSPAWQVVPSQQPAGQAPEQSRVPPQPALRAAPHWPG